MRFFELSEKEINIPSGEHQGDRSHRDGARRLRDGRDPYELREHSAGLNIGRWDYIFSCIKKFRANKNFCLATARQVTMTAPFMRAYALSLVKTRHRIVLDRDLRRQPSPARRASVAGLHQAQRVGAHERCRHRHLRAVGEAEILVGAEFLMHEKM